MSAAEEAVELVEAVVLPHLPHPENAAVRRVLDALAAANAERDQLRTAVERVEAVAARWRTALDQVLADEPAARITHRDVAAVDTCLSELRAALNP